jgi:macrolide transport system ATP-binding/permease protein
MAAGLTREQATRTARHSLGPVMQSMEECRDMRRVSFVDHRVQDLRFALRQLVKHRGFAATAIAMLALGLAANVTIFGFVDAALVRPLPYADASRLVAVFGAYLGKPHRGLVSYVDYRDLRGQVKALQSVDAFDVRTGHSLFTSSGVEQVSSLTVTSGFFRTLGVTPALGRDFRADEEGPSAPATVMLSYGAWQTRFGGDPHVLGRTVTLGHAPHVVIGVLPRGFHFTLAAPAEFWVTMRGGNYCRERRECRSLQAIGRLADGVSLQAADASLDAAMLPLRQRYPDSNRDFTAVALPMREVMLGDVRPILLVLLAGAALLLLIAGINVVSLLLARSDTRAREIAVRDALGASFSRLVLQFATESLVLVTIGAGLGLLLAVWGMRFLVSLLSADMLTRMPYLDGLGVNLRLGVFTAVVALVAAAVFAITPLARLLVAERFAGLKEGARGSAGATWRRFGAWLVMTELAVAVVLLVSAGLLGKSLYRLLRVDLGMDATHLATLAVTPPPGTPMTEDLEKWRGEGLAYARAVAERVAALPGVRAVGYADLLPLSPGLAPTSSFRVVGRGERDQRDAAHPTRRVSAGYFTALGAQLLSGRYFTEADVALQRPVLIVNQTMVRQYFPGEDAIGRQIRFGGPSSPAREIVGIVADIRDGPLEAPAMPAAYAPFDQKGFALVVRTSQDEGAALAAIAPAIRGLRQGTSVHAEMSMIERMNRQPSAHRHRSSAWVVGGFAALAFVLSVIGLYGVVAYSVGQRTREIGVRMALGAERRTIYRLVLGEAAGLVGVGTVVGAVCAVGAASLMRRLLFGVESWDAPTLVAAVVVLVVSALAASYVPARRAASVSPIEVLRAE